MVLITSRLDFTARLLFSAPKSMVTMNAASGSRTPATTPALSEQVVQDAFHSYLKSSLTQAKVERLLDAEILSSAEGDLMITGPALCLYFAALRCTTNPPSVPLPRSVQPRSSSGPVNLSYENCPPAFTSFLRVWAHLVPQIQSLPPEQQHDLARIICNLPPLGVSPNMGLGGIAADMRAVALEISQRRSFQDRYASALQAALDFDTGDSRGGSSMGGGNGEQMKRVASFVPPPVYEPTSPPVSNTHGDHLSIPPSPSSTLHSPPFPSSSQRSHSPSLSVTSSLRTPRTPSPTILAPGISPAIEFIRETLYAALGDTLELFPSLRHLLHSDPPRAYFASVSLAILFVSTNATDLNRRAVIGVMGTPLTLADCPQDLKPLMMELIVIGEAANELATEDDNLAIQALSEGRDAPEETYMERVKRILLEGVSYEHDRVMLNGGRRSAEGRAVSFANRIGELAVRMTSLSAFRERQDGVFKVLAGIGT